MAHQKITVGNLALGVLVIIAQLTGVAHGAKCDWSGEADFCRGWQCSCGDSITVGTVTTAAAKAYADYLSGGSSGATINYLRTLLPDKVKNLDSDALIEMLMDSNVLTGGNLDIKGIVTSGTRCKHCVTQGYSTLGIKLPDVCYGTSNEHKFCIATRSSSSPSTRVDRPTTVSQSQCLSAAKAAHGDKVTAKRPDLQVGSWGHVPSGCSVQSGGDWAAHYNTNTAMEPAGGTRASDRSMYTLVGSSATSPYGPFGLAAKCLAAAIATHGSRVTETRGLQVGNWDWVPTGCSVQKPPDPSRVGDWAAHYNKYMETDPARNTNWDKGLYTQVPL
eukprot:CAMPEP_0198709530 /NCGR_PEP_ID=MMETSP1471-20131121/1766_1 /TAXON_ID=41880 /ORGANISM="Pycnococcus provasolii, Strain RCC733" /LENGTH=331 /DNA_ID=CAMNT_0044468881 /DNA_START=334 /DNA_END=1332 /DNA_ORIENTATION=+